MGKIKNAYKDLLSEDEFHPKFAKEKISIWLDEDVVDQFRKQAQETGAKYQSVINQVLRKAVFPPAKSKPLDKIIHKLETAT